MPEREKSAQAYLWWDNENQLHVFGAGRKFDAETNRIASEFAKRAIMTQPLDYLAAVAKDFFRAFQWGRPVFPDGKNLRAVRIQQQHHQQAPPVELLPGQTHTDAMRYENGEAATVKVAPSRRS